MFFIDFNFNFNNAVMIIVFCIIIVVDFLSVYKKSEILVIFLD